VKNRGEDFIRSIDLLAGAFEVISSSAVMRILEQYDFSAALKEIDEPPQPTAPELLVLLGKTRISVAVTKKPWRLSVDAFTVPVDQSLEIGRLGKAFAEDVLDGSVATLQQLIHGQHSSVSTIDEQSPLLITLADDLADKLKVRQFGLMLH